MLPDFLFFPLCSLRITVAVVTNVCVVQFDLLRLCMDVVVCCHLDATGVSALELEVVQMVLAVLSLCKDMFLCVLMQNFTLFGEELSAWPWT